MEAILIFIMKAITAVAYIGFLIGIPVFFIWFIVYLVKLLLGKERMSGHLPWWVWFR